VHSLENERCGRKSRHHSLSVRRVKLRSGSLALAEPLIRCFILETGPVQGLAANLRHGKFKLLFHGYFFASVVHGDKNSIQSSRLQPFPFQSGKRLYFPPQRGYPND
jgi:hypothetical protein